MNRTIASTPRWWGRLARQLRADAIRASTAAGSGHPTSSMSAADLTAVLLARHLSYDWERPDHPDNDHFILSKGHASPLLYAAFKAVGVITDTELMTGYRRFGSRLQGHPTPVLPWVDVASGSLGQGIAIGVGVALAGKFLDRSGFHVWTLCGDSEMAEGSVWEALDKAGYYGLSNFTVIVDVNRLGQRGPTEFGWDLETYAKRVEAFGARAISVDGHRLEAIDQALTAARNTTQPTVILARTVKGRGFSEVEDREGWHGKAFPPEMARRALAELGEVEGLTVAGPKPASRSGQSSAPGAAIRMGSRTGRVTHRVRRSPPGRHTEPRWPHWARSIAGWWRSTAKSATPPAPQSSPSTTPSDTSKCSSPSNNSLPLPSVSMSATTFRSHRPLPRF